MRKLLVRAAMAASLLGPGMLLATQAMADAPPSGYRRHAHHGPAAPWAGRHDRSVHGGYRGHRHYGFRRRGFHGGGFAIGPSYGGLPAFYPGHGADAARVAGQPVMLTFYREAYIGRGLIYNTPPRLGGP